MMLNYIYKYFLRFIYFFFKVFRIKNKVVLISRFNKDTSTDFFVLEKELKKEYKYLKILNHRTNNPFLFFCYNLSQMYHLSTSEAAIIDSYIPTVSLLKHKKHLKVIQIWHASGAIKKFGYDAFGKEDGRNEKKAKIMEMHKNYDYVISGGKGSIPHFSKAFNIESEKVKAFGLPKMSILADKEKNKNISAKIKEKYNLTNKKTVLYAPTFRKENNIKYDELINKINFEKYNLIIKKHPNDKSTITKTDKIIIDNQYTVYELFTVADYLITDYSAISIDASILNIPVLFYLYDIKSYDKERGLNVNFKKDYPNITFFKTKDLNDMIEKEYDFKSLKRFNEKFISKDFKDSSENIVKLLKE